MPCRRHSSSGAIPASASFRMAMICSSLKRLLRTTPPLGPERAIVNGEVTFPLDYFSGGRSLAVFVFGLQAVYPATIPALLYAPLPLLLCAAARFGLGGLSLSLLSLALIS